jgi:hypothetical protein
LNPNFAPDAGAGAGAVAATAGASCNGLGALIIIVGVRGVVVVGNDTRAGADVGVGGVTIVGAGAGIGVDVRGADKGGGAGIGSCATFPPLRFIPNPLIPVVVIALGGNGGSDLSLSAMDTIPLDRSSPGYTGVGGIDSADPDSDGDDPAATIVFTARDAVGTDGNGNDACSGIDTASLNCGLTLTLTLFALLLKLAWAALLGLALATGRLARGRRWMCFCGIEGQVWSGSWSCRETPE